MEKVCYNRVQSRGWRARPGAHCLEWEREHGTERRIQRHELEPLGQKCILRLLRGPGQPGHSAGELALARERYFTGGCKTLRVGKREVIRGFEGKLQGKLSRRGFFWRKSAHNVTGTGNLLLEEAFDQKGGYLLVNRDFRNIIASRVFFNKALAWLKSEYYEPWDTQNARVIFKPVDADDLVERFDWDAAKKRYRSTMLYPVPYLEGDAGQSLLNAQFGEPKLLVSTGEGMFCYCPKEEAQRRKEALADLRRGTLVILPAWEVKEGSLAAPGSRKGRTSPSPAWRSTPTSKSPL